jgi:nucleoside-diphosphate-sugar epimerase
LDFKWARLFYQYGPFEHEKRLVPTTIRSLLRNRNIRINNGRLTRDFLHVHDTASAIWNLATSTISGSVNVGSGSPITVRSFVEKIGDIMDRRGLFTFRDSEDKQEPRVIYADISKLKNNTNWSPLYNLETGLRNTVEWWTKRLS